MQHLAFETAVEMKSRAPLDAQLKTMTWHVLLEMAGATDVLDQTPSSRPSTAFKDRSLLM